MTSLALVVAFTLRLLSTHATSTQRTRPTIRVSFVANVWTLQNSSDSLFVNQTVRVAVSDALGAVAQNQSLKDGRSAASKAFYSPQTRPAAAGVYALDPFFDRVACYLYPPTLPGDPSHMTLSWAMALQLLYAGVDLGQYNSTSYYGTTTVGGRECELWYRGFNTSDDARFCVERDTGLLLSANRTAWQGNIHEISKSVLTDAVAPVDPGAPYFVVPNKTGCVDLRALPSAAAAPVDGGGGGDDDDDVNDPARVARIDRAITAAGASWKTSKVATGTTVAEARDRVRRGGVLSANPWSRQFMGHHHRFLQEEPTSPSMPSVVPLAVRLTTPLPDSFDARDRWPQCSSIQAVRDQGKCGSCWAFSSAEALSDRLCTQTGTNATLSVEFLMDCNTDNNGCGGGLLDDSWRFMAATGLPMESCIPYQETAGPLPTGPIPCRAVNGRCLPGGDKTFALHRAAGGAYAAGTFTGDAEGMQHDLMANGPISVAFQVFSDFHSYSSGVYRRTAAGQLDGGHAVKIVGWGIDPAGGGPYWTVANSWGQGWGMKGFFHITRGVNECGIEQTPAGGMV